MSYLLLDIKCELREGSESVLFVSVSLVHGAELKCSRMSSLCDKINQYQYFEAVKSLGFCRDFQVLGKRGKPENHCSCPSSLKSISHFRAEGSSRIQARMEQQPARPPQPPQPPPPPPPVPFRAPTKPPVGPKTSPLKDNPSPEPQLDDIKRGSEHFLEPW